MENGNKNSAGEFVQVLIKLYNHLPLQKIV